MSNFITYTTTANTSELHDLLRQYNSVIRFSYNRWQENMQYSLAQIEKLVKTTMKGIDLIDASLIKLAVNEAKSLRKKKKIIFGSTTEFNKLKYHKGTANKSKFVAKRNASMLLRGSTSDNNGNRKAYLDISNNQVIVKINRNWHVSIPVYFSKKQKSDLLILETKCKNKESYFNLVINQNSIGISFDLNLLANKEYSYISNRVLAFDSNPNYLGIVVKQGKDLIHKEIINFSELNKKEIKNNKKKYEKHCISKYLVNLAKHYQCEAIAIEKLNIRSKNNNKGKTYNRLVNNTWHRTIIRAGIIKHACLQGMKVKEIIAAYSSVIGCLMHSEEIDSVAAAIEIADRALDALSGKRYNIKPDEIKFEKLPTQWKEMATSSDTQVLHKIKTAMDFYLFAKKMKFGYRFLFDFSKVNSFRHKSHKSLVSKSFY